MHPHPRLVAAIVAMLLCPAGAPAADGLIRGGRPAVHDGDTLQIGPVRIRLHGVDAPELSQTCAKVDGSLWACGTVARDRLIALIGDSDFACRAEERDAYGRVIGTCFADGRDVGREMVAEGLAWAYRHFSTDYAGEEDTARAAAAGIWQGSAQAAWDFRSSGWQAATGTRTDDPVPDGGRACAIKGNITAKGERVYHLPDSQWYARTRIDEAVGEHWFCSEAEAAAAGWRAAR